MIDLSGPIEPYRDSNRRIMARSFASFCAKHKITRKQLREQNFDLAVVLYNIEKGWGYANVESLAWSTGAGEQRGYFPNGSFKHLTLGNLLKNTIREQTALGWVALNIITAVFQLIIFGSAMAGEALYRRVFSKTPLKPRTNGRSQ